MKRLQTGVHGYSRPGGDVWKGTHGTEEDHRAVKVVRQEGRGGHDRNKEIHLLPRFEECLDLQWYRLRLGLLVDSCTTYELCYDIMRNPSHSD